MARLIATISTVYAAAITAAALAAQEKKEKEREVGGGTSSSCSTAGDMGYLSSAKDCLSCELTMMWLIFHARFDLTDTLCGPPSVSSCESIRGRVECVAKSPQVHGKEERGIMKDPRPGRVVLDDLTVLIVPFSTWSVCVLSDPNELLESSVPRDHSQ